MGANRTGICEKVLVQIEKVKEKKKHGREEIDPFIL